MLQVVRDKKRDQFFTVVIDATTDLNRAYGCRGDGVCVFALVYAWACIWCLCMLAVFLSEKERERVEELFVLMKV